MLILFSCQKELEFEGGDDTSRIVLNCVLESGEIIEVNLSNSKNILQEPSQYDSIVDATITIKNLAAGTSELMTHSYNGIYFSSTVPQDGEAYRIIAEHNDLDSVSGNVTIPIAANINALYEQTIVHVGETYQDIIVEFTDDLNSDNYYEVNLTGKVETVYSDTLGNVLWTQNDYIPVPFQILDQGLKSDFYGTQLFLADDEILSSSISVPCSIDLDLIQGYSGSDLLFINDTLSYEVLYDVKYTKIIAELKSISKAYHNYFVSVQAQIEASGKFSAEAVNVYSNMSNGFGVFGAYSSARDSVEINR